MKSFLPPGLLLVGMFVAGCNTPENTFMTGGQPVVVKPVTPVAKVAPAKPDAPIPVVAPQKPKPVQPEPVALVTYTPPVVMATATPPVVVATNTAAVAPVVLPDEATPAPTKPAEIPAAEPAAVALPTIVTPDTSIAGKVVAYNSAGRFVVLSFPAGPMPKPDQSIFLYRNGMKAGEIKITGPQRDNNTVGDVVNGDAQVGDEARDR
jgi:hypothetical protein